MPAASDGGSDGGADGGAVDAGVDAGLPASCQSAADCTGELPDSVYCVLGASCVDGRCLWECGGGRTCTVGEDAWCIACGAGPFVCGEASCGPHTARPFVEATSCWTLPGTEVEMLSLDLKAVTGTDCVTVLGEWDGGIAFGQYRTLTDSTLLAKFPAFGGTCTGVFLPTGALRILWSCPDCVFTTGPH